MRSFAIALLFALALGQNAGAQNAWPIQPVKLIVPYPAGGGADAVARVVSTAAAVKLGQAIVVENRPGAGTIPAADVAARAKPDGYTLLLADLATLATNPLLYKKLPYDPVTSFTPVTMVSLYPFVLVARKGFPATSPMALAEHMAKNPGGTSFASPGIGSPHHLAMELFLTQAKLNALHIPFKGSLAGLQALMAGDVDVMFCDLATAQAYLKDGKVQVLAVASAQRLPRLPDVPTVAESGFTGYQSATWTAVVAPASTPKDVITKLNEAFAHALRSPAALQQAELLAIEPSPSTPERVTQFARSEAEKLAVAIKARGIALD